MSRTVASTQLRQDWLIDSDRPMGDVTLDRAVLPGSLSVSLNGMLMVPQMYAYDAPSRTLTLRTILLSGDTVTAQGTPE